MPTAIIPLPVSATRIVERGPCPIEGRPPPCPIETNVYAGLTPEGLYVIVPTPLGEDGPVSLQIDMGSLLDAVRPLVEADALRAKRRLRRGAPQPTSPDVAAMRLALRGVFVPGLRDLRNPEMPTPAAEATRALLRGVQDGVELILPQLLGLDVQRLAKNVRPRVRQAADGWWLVLASKTATKRREGYEVALRLPQVDVSEPAEFRVRWGTFGKLATALSNIPATLQKMDYGSILRRS